VKRALILADGGVAGIAWELGVLWRSAVIRCRRPRGVRPRGPAGTWAVPARPRSRPSGPAAVRRN